MGSNHSTSTRSSSNDELNNNHQNGKIKKSASTSLMSSSTTRKFMNKLRRQSSSASTSRSDQIAQLKQYQQTFAIDPISIVQKSAQDHLKGEIEAHQDQTADIDQITILLTESTPTLLFNCELDEAEEEKEEIDDEKPVFVESDRHNTTSSSPAVVEEDRLVVLLLRSTSASSECEGDVERESTKQNTDKVVSCNSTATAIRSQQKVVPCYEEDFITASFSDKNCEFQTQNDREHSTISEIQNVQVEKSSVNWTDNLQIVQLQSYNLLPNQTSLQSDAVSDESLNGNNSNKNSQQEIQVTIGEEEVEANNNEMPIVKKTSSNENSQENGSVGGGGLDKGIFSISRVKKVELSEIPLASDICSTPPSSTDHASVTSSTPTSQFNASVNGNSSNIIKNGSGKVLHRVITLTTADNNLTSRTLSKPPLPPTFIPEKLQFSAYEKFEGQMLINWFVQSLQAVSTSMTTSLNDNDQSVLAYQYCNNLLTAGVIRKLDENSATEPGFKPNIFYQWMKAEPVIQSSFSSNPGKIDTSIAWPPSNNNNNSSSNNNNDKKQSPKGESKIPKLLSTSTPNKARIQLISNLVVLNDPLTPIETTEKRKLNDIKAKVGKCENVQEMLQICRSFLNEHNMQSSESSTNSGIFTTSLINNGTESTIYDRSMESTVFNILQHVPKTPPKSQTPPRSRTTSSVKSRTQPSTPTGSAGRLISSRRNLSVDSVNTSTSSLNNGKNTQNSKHSQRRMVDKATVMDIEPLEELPKLPEMKSIEIQTDPMEIETDMKMETEPSKVIPPPPPPMMLSAPIPPPPPPLNLNPPPIPPGPPPPAPPLFSLQNNQNLPPMPPPPNLASAAYPATIPTMPLPPPNLGPGKLANASSNSTSTNDYCKPKPLPFPASEFYSTNTLRKKAVNPPKSMKPLYWTRIVAPIKLQDAVDGSQSPEIEKEPEDEEELWKEIDETNLDNLDEFTELFSRQGIVPKIKTATPMPKIKSIKVLDSKRSQNVGIFVRSIHVDFSEIEHAIYHCDTSVVSLETLQHIMEIRGTNEELSLIKEAISSAESNENDIPPHLDAPENFLLKISQISSSAERISCIVFQAEFDEQCTMVSRKLMTLKSICEFLIENDGLKEVFSIILTLGNFMNGGNRQRGQADGFGLEILGKLKDVKSRDPKITLLHFIVKTFIERCRKNGRAICDLVAPVPNPNDVEKMLSIDFDECRQQLNALKTKLDECRKTTEKVALVATSDHQNDGVQPFKDKMEQFLEMAVKKIDSRFEKLDECQIVYIKTLKFYKFTAKKGTLEETPPQQFFEYWTTFCSDFNDIFKKEIQILTNKLFKKTQQVTKPQSKPSTGENNLKARINRLKNRN